MAYRNMNINWSHDRWQHHLHILMDCPAVVSATEIKGRGRRAEVAEWNWSSRSATHSASRRRMLAAWQSQEGRPESSVANDFHLNFPSPSYLLLQNIPKWDINQIQRVL